MSNRPVAVYDANVLYPAQLRDLLIRVAARGLVRAHWTDEIHEEWIRNVLVDYVDVAREALERTRRLMERALPAAQVMGYRRHIARLSLPDPDDRHVLAAAIEAGADHIVSFNLTDFPPSELDPHGISAVHPDAFIISLCEEHLDEVIQVLRQHRLSLRRPSKSVREYLRMLEKSGLHHAADQFAAHEHRL